jgi:hypothetical protein
MKEKFDEKIITGEDKRIMSIWGPDDCFFAEEEICLILGWTVEQFRGWIRDFSLREPKAYEYFVNCRKKSAHQLKFENNVRRLSGEYLDGSFEWDREKEFISNNTNITSIYLKKGIQKSVEEDNSGLGECYGREN